MKPEEILELLRSHFPNKLPNDPSKDFSRLIGQQDVVEYLENQLIVKGIVENKHRTKE